MEEPQNASWSDLNPEPNKQVCWHLQAKRARKDGPQCSAELPEQWHCRGGARQVQLSRVRLSKAFLKATQRDTGRTEERTNKYHKWRLNPHRRVHDGFANAVHCWCLGHMAEEKGLLFKS